jgi:type IV secretory pathway VirB4 component
MPTSTNTPSKASQDFVPVSEVRDGVMTLKDGGLRGVLMASSINFALKSEDEQTAFIVQFQAFLNSLDFSCQIFIQSRDLDIRPYISTLEESYKKQLDDLMRVQIREYIEFVKGFTEQAHIMQKNFFVIVPYTPISLGANTQSGGLFSMFNSGTAAENTAAQAKTFEENLSQLEQRVAIVQQGLVRAGVRSVQLGTEEVIELLYKIFNPGEQSKPIQL